MVNEHERERLLADVHVAAYEVVTLRDFGSEILPLLDRLFDTSTSLLYRYPKEGEIEDIAGSLSDSHREYTGEYFADDPMQSALRRLDPWLFHATSVPEYADFLGHPVHTECATHYGMDNFLHLKLSDRGVGEEGMVGLLLARTSRQPDFGEKERMGLSALLRPFEALVRRSARFEGATSAQPYLESILNGGPYPIAVFDVQGSFLWGSERAKEWLGWSGAGKARLPEALTEAVRRLGALAGRNPALSSSYPSVPLRGPQGTVLRADLRLCRDGQGLPFIVAEFDGLKGAPVLIEVAARYGLTPAETQVLELVAEGLSDKEIGARLFVSFHTVRSHVTRVLGKLGVTSRVKAARLALGHGVTPDSD